MQRRTFLKQAGLGIAGLSISRSTFMARMSEAQPQNTARLEFYVAVDGADSNPGTMERPFATLSRAQAAVRAARREARSGISVLVRGGTYYHSQPLTFTYEDSGSPSVPIVYMPFGEEPVTISGGRKLECNWRPFRDGIFATDLSKLAPEVNFDQLFVNGKRQILARYPNYDDSEPGKSGYQLLRLLH